MSDSLPEEHAEVATIVVNRAAPDRPAGPAFGLLVHAVLADVPLDATAGIVASVARAQGRALGAAADDIDAAIDVAQRVLNHDLTARARAADARGACRRETPVTYRMTDGTLVEGVLDLAFEEQGAWTVVDYKTDRELAVAGEDRYRRQIALYAASVARATGKRASGVLVRV